MKWSEHKLFDGVQNPAEVEAPVSVGSHLHSKHFRMSPKDKWRLEMKRVVSEKKGVYEQ